MKTTSYSFLRRLLSIAVVFLKIILLILEIFKNYITSNQTSFYFYQFTQSLGTVVPESRVGLYHKPGRGQAPWKQSLQQRLNKKALIFCQSFLDFLLSRKQGVIEHCQQAAEPNPQSSETAESPHIYTRGSYHQCLSIRLKYQESCHSHLHRTRLGKLAFLCRQAKF